MGLAPGHPAGPGQPRRGTGALHRRLGFGPRRGRASTPPASWPPWRASARSGDPAVRALVLLGADPLSDFPDHAVADGGALGRALRRGGDRPPLRVGRRTRRRGAALRGGPRARRDHDQHRGAGQPARAQAHGAGLRLARLDDRGRAGRRARRRPRRDERQRPGRRARGHGAGLRRADPGGAALRRRPRRDPRARSARTTTTRDVSPIDPIALPGVESVERQGAPPRVGTGGRQPRARRAPATLGGPPPLLSGTGNGGDEPIHVPKADNYTLRLVAGRRLYDAGSSVTGSPSLTPLVPALVARANPYDLDRLGADDRRPGEGALGPGRAGPGRRSSDEGVPRGVVAIDFNVPGGESAPGNAVATLIDSRQLGDRRADGVGVIAALFVATAHASNLGPQRADAQRGQRERRPALLLRPQLGGLAHRHHQVPGRLRGAAGRHGVDDLVRAQGDLGHAEPGRSEPGRAVGSAADAGRRHQAHLQGGPAARPGGRLRLQAGAVPVGDPGRA